MGEYPGGGIIGKAVRELGRIRRMQVPVHAANACYFIVLAVFPGLLVLLSLLRCTSLEVERLGELVYGLLPEALAVGAEEWILLTYDQISGTVAGVSAAAALWSASRGMYGVITGLRAIYGGTEHRGYVHSRLLSLVYMLAFLVLLVLTLMLHVFSGELAAMADRTMDPVLQLAGRLAGLSFPVLPLVQTGFFAAMFAVVPGAQQGLRQSLPGAALAALGWQIFSDLYSVYVERFAYLSNIYGSVYAVALSMLWLYCCMSIVFYGGVLNVLLQGENVSEP